MAILDYEEKKRRIAVPQKILLTSKQAAAYLGLNQQWLAQARFRGGSPPYIKFGDAQNSPVRYDVQDLNAWIVERTVKVDADDE